MAKLIPGPVVAHISGKVGNLVFCNTYGTPFVRRKARHYVSNTPAQKAVRSAFATYPAVFPRSGWHVGRDFYVISTRLQRRPISRFVSGSVRAFRHSLHFSLFPQAHLLKPFQLFTLADIGIGIVAELGLNIDSAPHRTHIIYIGDNGVSALQQFDTNPGDTIEFFGGFANGVPHPPLIALAFNVQLTAGPPFPLQPLWWNTGGGCRLP